MTSSLPVEFDFALEDEAEFPEDTDDGYDRVYDYTPPTVDELTRRAPAVTTSFPTTVPDHLLEGLNPEQRTAVTTLNGPLLVVAGPGSGKTRVLVHRIAALVATGIPPWRILAVTFTNKAAAEMRTRVANLVGEDTARSMWVSTFHSACVRILRYHHAEAGLPRSFTIVDTTDGARILRDVLADLDLSTGLNASETKQLIRTIASTISKSKNDGISADDLARSPFPDLQLAAQAMAAYNARLTALGAVDFDDILLRTHTLLRTHADLRQQWARRFSHILIDEYQDTNAVQYAIVNLLGAGHGNVCVVGDADQSIYAFRGANPSVLRTFTNDFPAAVVVTLGRNYRSTSTIIEVVSAVIDANPAQHRAQLSTDNPPGEPVRLFAGETSWDEARWVISQIRRHGGKASEHAVLVRTNALTRALEQELAENRIAYQVVGALRFYDRAEVKDALSWLRCVVNPADAVSFERATSSPKRGVGPTTIQALFTQAMTEGTTVVDVARVRAVGTSAAARKLAGFLVAYDAVAEATTRGPAAALEAVAEAAGLRAALRAAAEKDVVNREENLDELIDFARLFTTSGSATDPESRVITELPGWEQTEAFLENVALVSAAETATGEDVPDDGMVSLLTMHAAKGKEYPHVYVVGLEDNVLPHVRALESGQPAELEEERRLLFVATSRAQTTLDLSYARARTSFGKEVRNAPSRFLSELPDTVERLPATAKAKWAGSRVVPSAPTLANRAASGLLTARPNKGVLAGPRLSAAQAHPGVAVTHTAFGPGTIVRSDTTTVTVKFADGEKTLLLRVAPLTLAG